MIVVATWSFMSIDLALASVGTVAIAGWLTGPAGIGPKYFSTSALTLAGWTSPATTSTALLGPYLSRNHCLTSARLAASRSVIEPITV